MNFLFARTTLIPASITCSLLIGGYFCITMIYQSYRSAVYKEIKPLFEYANKCYAQGAYDEALSAYKDIIMNDAGCAAAHFNLGQIYLHKKEWDLACAHYQKSIDSGNLADNEYLAYFNYAYACNSTGHQDQALKLVDKAIVLNPNYHHAYALRAKIKHESGFLSQALSDYQEAGKIDPYYMSGVLAVGNSYRDTGNIDAAIACYSTMIKAQPHHYAGYLSRADVLHIKSKQIHDPQLFEQSKDDYRSAIIYNPSCNEAMHNLGFMVLEEEHIDEALALFKQAISIKNDPGTHLGVGIAYLLRGDYERGWAKYEYRLANANVRHTSIPQWDGKASLLDKTILIHAEQGYGDTFHFIRYAQLIKQKGARVVVEVQPRLKQIIALCPYIDQVIEQGDEVPHCDLHVPLLSLPALTKTTIKTVPRSIPYLYADEQLVDYWGEKIASNKHYNVGVCWSVDASHDFTKYHGVGDHQITIKTPKRSIPLALLNKALGSIEGVALYSLQKNAPEDVTTRIHVFDNFDTKNGAFMDTAALIKNLDLVITVDTSIAHLAGALGVPTWIMLPRYAEWRWLQNRSDSVWYPSVRLFRQKNEGDWHELIERVASALTNKIKTGHRG